MTPKVEDPAKLYREVRAVLAKRRAGVKVSQVICTKKLRNSPLYLTDPQCENLAPKFQEIARERKDSARFSQAETKALTTVLDAYNLVGKKAGFDKVGDCKDLPALD